MLHRSSCTHLTSISRTYQTIARIVTALVVWFGFLLMFLNRPPAAPCRQWRRGYFNALTLKNQDKNINSPKKLQAAEHLRTQRPEKLSKKPGTTPDEAFTSHRYYTQSPRLVNRNSTSNIKNSTSKKSRCTGIQRRGIPKICFYSSTLCSDVTLILHNPAGLSTEIQHQTLKFHAKGRFSSW